MAMRGRKPRPKAVGRERSAFGALPRCPPHLNEVARKEWRRLASPLHAVGVLTVADRAALAAYCQSYARWVEAEEKLAQTPALLKTPSGYVQQSPWLSVANKQLEVMGRYMSELGLTPVARVRLDICQESSADRVTTIEFVTVYTDREGNTVREPMRNAGTPARSGDAPKTITHELNEDL